MKQAAPFHAGLAVLLTTVVAGCALDMAAPGGGSPAPFTTFVTSPPDSCPAVRDSTVLVDASKDRGVWWNPQQPWHPYAFTADSAHQGKALTDYLRARGFIVTELGPGATMPSDSLLGYATVIRAGPIGRYPHWYSDEDLAAYAAYVSCPRTLVLLGEFLRNGELVETETGRMFYYPIQRDKLADHIGLPLAGAEMGVIATFAAHDLTIGVSHLPWLAGSVLDDEAGPGIQVLGRLENGKAAMGIATSHVAKVFWIGDTNGIQQVPQPFVANLVAWGFR